MHIKEKLHVGYPNIGDQEKFLERVRDILDSHWLTNRGSYVQDLEQHLADYLGVKHCISMCNGTVALEIAIKALGLKGEVIIPSFTFIATAHALQWQEIQPVFCDIEPETYCIDPAEVEKHITPNTTAIMGVHLYGQICNVEALQEVADKHNLELLFDAAHALGSSHNGTKVGNFGTCEVLSFHATKVFNTFEGGAITTNDDALAEKIRLMQNFGFKEMDEVIHIGTNGKMDEVSAAMGLTNFEALDDFIAVNKRNYELYKEAFGEIPGLDIMPYNNGDSHNYQYIVTELSGPFEGRRDELMEKLHQNNVRVRRYFWPGCHRQEPYKSLYPYARMQLSQTEEVGERILVFPTGPQVEPETITEIANLIKAEQ